jgi:hypothetical protein
MPASNGRIAIVGIAESDYGRVPNMTELQLHAQAIQRALEDSGEQQRSLQIVEHGLELNAGGDVGKRGEDALQDRQIGVHEVGDVRILALDGYLFSGAIPEDDGKLLSLLHRSFTQRAREAVSRISSFVNPSGPRAIHQCAAM